MSLKNTLSSFTIETCKTPTSADKPNGFRLASGFCSISHYALSFMNISLPNVYKNRILRTALILSLFVFASVSTMPITPSYAQEIGTAEQSAANQGDLAQVAPMLLEQLEAGSSNISFLIILKEQPDVERVLASVQFRSRVGAASRDVRAHAIYNSLTADAVATQQSVVALLQSRNAPYTQFYVTNMIEVEGDIKLVNALRRHPDVAELVPNPWIRGQLSAGTESTAASTTSARYMHKTWSWLTELAVPEGDEEPEMTLSAANLAQPYGLGFTGAPNVWAQGITGQNIVIASQDTGVEWDHPALKSKYRGWDAGNATASHAYHWFDAWETQSRPESGCLDDAQVPCDDHGHGTHTVGTMLGDTGVGGTVIGMAPDAEWMGCRNMAQGIGTIGSYTACFEFFLAPYPQGGNKMTDGNPALAPHIINNSWSCPPEEGCTADSLLQVVETVRAAGIMVVGAAGNGGTRTADSCSTVMNPIAIYDATYSIGAHDVEGNITSFSSRGPVTIDDSGRAKPDLAAPGYLVESAAPLYKNPSGYGTSSGTSMASPHVAGAAALIWSAAPSLIGEVSHTEEILNKSATPVPSNACGEGSEPVTPNHTYGFGQLNVEAAVAMAQTPASAEITLLNCSGSALPNALVTLTDEYTGYKYQARTGPSGVAAIPQVYASQVGDEFTLSAQAGNANLPASTVTLSANVAFTTTLQAATRCAQPLPLSIRVESGDDSNAIPLALVVVTSVETGLSFASQSDADGNVIFPSVYQGEYELTISAAGHTFEPTILTVPEPDSTTIPPQIIASIVQPNLQAFMPLIFK